MALAMNGVKTAAHASDQMLDRFDVQVIEAFKDSRSATHTRDKLIAQVRNGDFAHLLLKRLSGLEKLPDALNEKAAINVIDFYFESFVLQKLDALQLESYLRSVTKTLQIQSIDGVNGDGPLWIDTVHHTCLYSVIYDFAVHLARYRGYRKLILVLQGARTEPRIHIIGRHLAQMQRMQLTLFQPQGNWFPRLAKLTTPDTAIVYIGDTHPVTATRRASASRVRTAIQLNVKPNVSFNIRTVSGAAAFAKRLDAAHLVLEYPEPDAIRVRTYDSANSVTRCPLEEWAFWPSLTAV